MVYLLNRKSAGSVVQVRERQLQLRVFSKGRLIATLNKRPRSKADCAASRPI